MLETFSYILAGIGLFFVGLKLLSSGLQQMSNRKMRTLLANWTQRIYQGSLIGFLSGLLTQSIPALTFIVSSMMSAGIIQLKQALPVILWANVGCSLLVFIAFLDIRIATMIIIGLTGICYAFNRPKNHIKAIQVLFGLGLMLFGLNTLQTSAAVFTQEEWFRSLLSFAVHSYLLAFLLGIVLTVIIQSGTALKILAISMTASGIFAVDETIMIICGSLIGSSILTYLLSKKIKGSPKQIIMSNFSFNFVAVALFLPLFYLETQIGLPLIKSFTSTLSEILEIQLAYIGLSLNLGGAILLTLFIRPFARFLEKHWSATEVEEWSKLAYLNDNVLYNTESALVFMEMEQNRIIKRFPLYMAKTRDSLEREKESNLQPLHEAFLAISQEITAYEEELLKTNLSYESSEELIILSSRLKIMANIEHLLYRLAEQMIEWGTSPKERSFITPFLESMDLLLLILEEIVEDKEEESIQLLLQLTHDRNEMMQKFRKNYLSSERDMTDVDRKNYLQLTSLFERFVWVIHQLTKTFDKKSQERVKKTS